MSADTSYDNTSYCSPSMEHQIDRDTLDGHSKRVWCVAPLDNERVVSASDDDSVVVWKFRAKEEERRWSHKGAMTVAVSPGGRRVISGGRDCALRLWDPESEHLLSGPWKLHDEKVWSVSWSPDGDRIASCSADGTLIIWNARPDSPSGEPFLGPISTEQKAVYTVAYCPKGEKLATGGHNFTVKIWDALTGHLQATLHGHTLSVTSVAWTKDGRRVISGSLDCTARVWDILEQKTMCEIPAHTGAIKYIAVSDHVFATASYDHAYLWSLATHQRLSAPFDFSKCDEANCVALSEDENTMIACTERGKVYTWNIGSITSTLKQSAKDDKLGDVGDINVTRYNPDDVNNPYEDNFFGPFRDSPPSQARGGIGAPVKGARRATGVRYIQRIVAPLRTRRKTTTLTSPRHFWKSPGPSVARLALDKPTSGAQDHIPRPVTTIGRSPQVTFKRYKAIPISSRAELPPLKPLRDHSSWHRFWANVRRLLRLHRHGKVP